MSTNSSEPTSVADEIAAMRRIVAALDKLDPATQHRVAQWLFDRYHRWVDHGEVPYEPIPKSTK